MGERGEEKITEVVAHEATPGVEAILKKAAKESFIFRKSDHTVADVAGRKDAVFAAQAAGAAAVIGDGDDGGEIGDGALGSRVLIGAADDVFLESAKKGREAGAAAEGDYAETAVQRFRFERGLFQERSSLSVRFGYPADKIIHRIHRERRIHREGEQLVAFRNVLTRNPRRFAVWTWNEADRLKPVHTKSIGEAVFLWIEEFGEAWVFLEKGKILVVAGMEAVLGAQLDGDLEIGHRGISFPGKAIERGQRVVNVIRLRRGFAGFLEALARVIPAADVHHGYTALIMLVGGAGILLGARLHALLGDTNVHAGAIGELLAGAL